MVSSFGVLEVRLIRLLPHAWVQSGQQGPLNVTHKALTVPRQDSWMQALPTSHLI